MAKLNVGHIDTEIVNEPAKTRTVEVRVPHFIEKPVHIKVPHIIEKEIVKLVNVNDNLIEELEKRFLHKAKKVTTLIAVGVALNLILSLVLLLK